MSVVLQRKWWLAAVVSAAAVSLVPLARTQGRFVPAPAATDEAPAPPAIVAAAPGWVDLQGGTRHLAAQGDGTVVATAPAGDALVDAGTVLLRLDDAALALDEQGNALDLQQHRQAQADAAEQLQRAKEEATRVQGLVRIQAESADGLRQAQALVRTLEAAVRAEQREIARTELRQRSLALERGHLVVVAPSRGRVLRVDVHEGEAVGRGAAVVWFAPAAPLIVRAELDERLFSRVKVGMPAEVQAEDGDGRVHRATLVSIAPQVGPVRALPEVRAAATDDRVVECVLSLQDAELLIGQRVVVRLRELP